MTKDERNAVLDELERNGVNLQNAADWVVQTASVEGLDQNAIRHCVAAASLLQILIKNPPPTEEEQVELFLPIVWALFQLGYQTAKREARQCLQ